MKEQEIKELSDMSLIHIVTNKDMFHPDQVELAKTEWSNRDIKEMESNAIIKMYDDLIRKINTHIKEGESKEYIKLILLNQPIDHEIVLNTLNFNIKKKSSNTTLNVFLALFALYQTIRQGLNNEIGIIFGILFIGSIFLIVKDFNKN